MKAYKPETKSICSGQVLQHPYPSDDAKLVVREMAELLVLDLVEKGLVTNQLILTIGYDIENLKDPAIRKSYRGAVTTDYYGRKTPKHAHGTTNLKQQTASTKIIVDAVMTLFDQIINRNLLIRRIHLSANNLIPEAEIRCVTPLYEQLDLFTDYAAVQKEAEQENKLLERERKRQKAMIEIQKRFGKSAIVKGMSLQKGATTLERNKQIGGHKA